jgi:2-aminoadipate transaminase
MSDTVVSSSIEAHWSQAALRGRIPLMPPLSAPIRYNLGQGVPAPEAYPRQDLEELATEVLEQFGDHALEYYDPHYGESEMVLGDHVLRARIADQLSAVPGHPAVSADHVMLTSGSAEAIGIISSAFVDPGDGVIVEDVTYMRPVEYMRALGANVVTVPVHADGIDPDDVVARIDALRRSGCTAKLLYTIATFQSPVGASISAEKRSRLIEVARAAGMVIVEDNVYAQLRFAGTDLPSMYQLDGSGVVMQVDSFSKTLAPGLRHGWMVGPPSALRRMLTMRRDLGVSVLISKMIDGFLAKGRMEPHLARLRSLYRNKLDIATQALDEHLADLATWQVPEGSIFLWIAFEPRIDVARMVQIGETMGVSVRPGSVFSVAGGTHAQYVRIAFGRPPDDDIAPAIALLGRAARQAATA